MAPVLHRMKQGTPLSRAFISLAVGSVVLAAVTMVSSPAAPSLSQQSGEPGIERVLVPGEELVYKVSYLFNLGEIRTKVLEQYRDNGQLRYKLAAYIKSYPLVPYRVRSTMESSVDSLYRSCWFQSKELDGGEWKYIRYTYGNGGRSVAVKIWRGGETLVDTVLQTKGDFQDGLSLLFFARGVVHRRGTVSVPTLAGSMEGTTYLNLTGETTRVQIDAVGYPVKVLRFDGRADFIGFFGLTGGFEGWFSNDDASIPITAKLHVIIGSVSVELQEWKRPGWNPPKW